MYLLYLRLKILMLLPGFDRHMLPRYLTVLVSPLFSLNHCCCLSPCPLAVQLDRVYQTSILLSNSPTLCYLQYLICGLSELSLMKV